MRNSRNRWRAATGRCGFAAALAVALLAAACDDKREQAAQEPDRTTHARRLAEEQVLAKIGRAGAVLRGVQVYRQAVPATIAVCGRVNPSGRNGDAYIPFVTIVTYETAAEGGPGYQLVQHLADSNAAATRVYVEMVSRCFEGGGPGEARRHLVQSLPPVPNGLPRQQVEEAAPTPAPAEVTPVVAVLAPAAQPSARTIVTTRQHANVRMSPAGGGGVLRVAPPGTTMRVFGEAPGGWYQVGDTEPWGWIHGSMLAGP